MSLDLAIWPLSVIICAIIGYVALRDGKRVERMESELREKIKPHIKVLEDELAKMRARRGDE